MLSDMCLFDYASDQYIVYALNLREGRTSQTGRESDPRGVESLPDFTRIGGNDSICST